MNPTVPLRVQFSGVRYPDLPVDLNLMTNFAILGAGAWGTAIGLVLAKDAAHHVRLWSARADHRDTRAGGSTQCSCVRHSGYVGSRA